MTVRHCTPSPAPVAPCYILLWGEAALPASAQPT